MYVLNEFSKANYSTHVRATFIREIRVYPGRFILIESVCGEPYVEIRPALII